MPTFVYEARRKTGEQVSGSQEATDQRAAIEALRAQELFVTSVRPAKGGREMRRSEKKPPANTPEAVSSAVAVAATASAVGVAQGNEKTPAPVTPPHSSTATPSGTPFIPNQPLLHASAKELSLFYRQLGNMLDAGTSLGQALQILGQNAPNAALRRAAAQMSEWTSKGQPMSELMRSYPALFPELAIGMIYAGENGGFLDRMCIRLADYAERDYEIQQTLKRETWYPKLLVFCCIFIPSVAQAVIAGITGGGSPLRAFLGVALPPAIVIAGVWFAWKSINRAMPVVAHGGAIRETIDGLKPAIPGVSKMSRSLASAKFCRALSALYAAGAAPGKMIDVSAGASGNAAFAARVRSEIPSIRNGSTLTEALERSGQFPTVALQMLRTGEMSGRIDEQLDKVADFMEQDTETAIKQLVKVAGIAALLFVGCYIGYLVVNFWTGYFGGLLSMGESG